MKQALSAFPRDELGRVLYGDPTKGCRFCASVAEKVAENGKAIVYHPSLECCDGAVAAQIGWRQREIKTLEKRIDEHNESLGRLEEEAQKFGKSQTAAANEARFKLNKARQGIHRQVAVLQGSFDNAQLPKAEESNVLNIRGLELEIVRLQKKLNWIRKQAA
jgi:hypothetical protein